MWWSKKEDKQPANYDLMALGFLQSNAEMRIEGHCTECDGYQPIYLHLLIEEHGKTAPLRDVQSKIPCLFCKRQGSVVVTIST